MRENLHILSNSAKFSAGWPILRVYNFFSYNGLYLLRLSYGGCGLPKIFGDCKHASNYGKIAYRRLL